MPDSTQIDPYSSSNYKNPFESARPISERKQNVGGYLYDAAQPEFGDKLSLPDGKYELRQVYFSSTAGYGSYFIFDSNDKWTGWNVNFQLKDSDGVLIPYKKPISLTFLNGEYSPKVPKNSKPKFGPYYFFLIDNTYPKYTPPGGNKNTTANATVIDSNTGKPIKAKAN
jgi:hypothetical protein